MRAQIRGLNMASKNAQDGISLIQTAEGGMQEIDNMIQRIRELTVYASNDTQEQNSLGTGDRQKIQDEIHQLAKEIDSMADRVEFNKKKIINGECEAVPKNATYSTNLETAKSQLAAAKEAYAAQETATQTAHDAITAAKDLMNTILNDNRVDSILTDLTSTPGSLTPSNISDVRVALDALQNLGTQGSVISDATFTSIFTPLVTTLTGAMATLKADIDTNGTATQKADDAYLNGMLSTAGAVKGATDAWKAAFVNAEAADTTLANKSADVGTKTTALLTAQTAYNSAEKTDALYFQIGANSSQGINVSISSVKTDKLGLGNGDGSGSTINVLALTGKDITAQLDTIDTALSYVTTERSKMGAVQNRLEYTISSLDISAENLTAAESRIRDVDMAKEMTNFTKQNILFQASTAMLAQANAFPQGVLQLLG
jgi:flagellin